MAIVITPESALGIEMAKWNKPYRYEEFPRLMYRAQRRHDGIVSVGEGDDRVFPRDSRGDVLAGSAEAFSRGCQRLVKSEYEHTRALEEGWRNTQAEALEHFEAKERSIADQAAHRAHDDKNMGELAKIEAKTIEDATHEHVPEIPRKRGRPRKAA